MPWLYFILIFALSVPLDLWGVVWPVHGSPFELPAIVGMIVLPAIVATWLTRREQGPEGARALWRRLADIRRAKDLSWVAAAVLLMPLTALAAYAVMLVFALPLPGQVVVPVEQAPLMIAVFMFGAAFEEIGWTGYATEPLQRRFGILGAGLVLGTVWALWHVIPWGLRQEHSLSWVLGQSLATILMRVVMGWIYARGGRCLSLAVVFHAMINVSYRLFPNQGSHYDPWVIALVLTAVVVAALASQRTSGGSNLDRGTRWHLNRR